LTIDEFWERELQWRQEERWKYQEYMEALRKRLPCDEKECDYCIDGMCNYSVIHIGYMPIVTIREGCREYNWQKGKADTTRPYPIF